MAAILAYFSAPPPLLFLACIRTIGLGVVPEPRAAVAAAGAAECEEDRPMDNLGAEAGGRGTSGLAAGSGCFCGTVSSTWQDGHWIWCPDQSSSQTIG